MNRRGFIVALGGAVAWPLAARAQQSERVRRIGVLSALAENDPVMKARLAALRQGLETLGWSERRIHMEVRHVPAGDRAQEIAKELVALQPDLIVAISTPMAAAVQRESRLIPIVFAAVSDPVGSGFIVNLARPGGNLTGLLLYEDGITGKWLSMLKEIAPRVDRIALLANPKTTPYDYFLRSAKATVSSLAIELIPSPVENAADIERIAKSIASVANGGLVLLPDIATIAHRDLIISLAAKLQLPAVYHNRLFVVAGGLMSYGTDLVDPLRQAASYVDRILRGEKPADLPVQAPTKYETALNLKTAKALGLTVPPTLLVAADEVIE